MRMHIVRVTTASGGHLPNWAASLALHQRRRHTQALSAQLVLLLGSQIRSQLTLHHCLYLCELSVLLDPSINLMSIVDTVTRG